MEKESQNAQRHGWCLPPLNLAWGISYVQTFYILPSLCLGFACSPASSPSFREICLFPKDNKVVHIEPQCPSSLGTPLVLLAPPQIVWLPAQAHLWAEAPCALEHPATRTLPAVVPQQEPRARAARAGQGSGHWYSVPASVPEWLGTARWESLSQTVYFSSVRAGCLPIAVCLQNPPWKCSALKRWTNAPTAREWTNIYKDEGTWQNDHILW